MVTVFTLCWQMYSTAESFQSWSSGMYNSRDHLSLKHCQWLRFLQSSNQSNYVTLLYMYIWMKLLLLKKFKLCEVFGSGTSGCHRAIWSIRISAKLFWLGYIKNYSTWEMSRISLHVCLGLDFYRFCVATLPESFRHAGDINSIQQWQKPISLTLSTRVHNQIPLYRWR